MGRESNSLKDGIGKIFYNPAVENKKSIKTFLVHKCLLPCYASLDNHFTEKSTSAICNTIFAIPNSTSPYEKRSSDVHMESGMERSATRRHFKKHHNRNEYLILEAPRISRGCESQMRVHLDKSHPIRFFCPPQSPSSFVSASCPLQSD